MPLSVLFPKLYVQLTVEGKTIERSFTNVKTLAWWVREFPSGTYRDQPSVQYGTTTNELGKAFVEGMPVYGSDALFVPGQTYNKAIGTARHIIADDVAHIPPRSLWVKEGGVLIGVTDAALPASPEPAFASAAFVINTATNICAITGSTLPFSHGDIVAIVASTAPAAAAATPFSLTSVYTLVKLTTTSFLLRNSAGQIIDFTSAGLNCQAVLITSARLPEPVPAAFSFFREAWNPRLFSDPALTSAATLLP